MGRPRRRSRPATKSALASGRPSVASAARKPAKAGSSGSVSIRAAKSSTRSRMGRTVTSPSSFTRQMRPHARPGPVLRPLDQARPHRVQGHIADGQCKGAFVHHHRGIPAVEQMSAPAPTRIDEVRPSAVSCPHGQTQPIGRGWAEDQVHVVGHQAIGPHLDLRLAHLLGQHVAIDVVVAVFEEDRLTPIAPLRHMMRRSRGDDARKAGHGSNWHSDGPEQKGNIAPVPLIYSGRDGPPLRQPGGRRQADQREGQEGRRRATAPRRLPRARA